MFSCFVQYFILFQNCSYLCCVTKSHQILTNLVDTFSKSKEILHKLFLNFRHEKKVFDLIFFSYGLVMKAIKKSRTTITVFFIAFKRNVSWLSSTFHSNSFFFFFKNLYLQNNVFFIARCLHSLESLCSAIFHIK